MIPSTETDHATVGRHTATLQMGIDPSAFKHLMDVLTNLYSDKALAVIREYSTNALDSHVEAGCPDKPIQVTLPVHGSRTPVFKVQDFGVGLSFDELRDVYAQYGASSKRMSNDVNGMLGLGCKSALTFASTFTITSVKDGRKVMAVISKDAEGLGAIKVLADLPTTEENGVAIEVPVPTSAVKQFRETAKEFYAFWEPGTVLIDGKHPEQGYFHRQRKNGGDSIWITPDILVTKGGYNVKSKVIMGSVAYPQAFGWPSNITVYAWVPIGAVDFVPAREALRNTDRTNSVVKSIKDTVTNLLVKRIEEHAAKGTVFERNNTLYEWGVCIPIAKREVAKVKTDPRLTFKVSYGKASRYQHQTVDWRIFQDKRMLIVSDFPFLSVGTSHKARLNQFWAEGQALLLPPSADLSAIEGHPRLVAWDHVVKSTQKPAPAKRQPTTYRAVKEGAPDWEATNFGNGTDIYYTTQRIDVLRGVWQVVLKPSQIERFRRVHPAAQSAESLLRRKVQAAQAALTEDDRLAYCIQRGSIIGPFKDPNLQSLVSRLDDPLLRRVIGLTTHVSPTLTHAGNLGAVPSNTEVDKIAKEIQDRYPLISTFSSCMLGNYYNRKNVTEDIIIYLNAKYRQLINGKKA